MAAGKPLASLLGGAPRPIPAYNSNGLGLMEPEQPRTRRRCCSPAAFAQSSCGSAIPRSQADLAAVRAVRKRLPDEVALMVDYNQALTVAEALRRGRALDDEGIVLDRGADPPRRLPRLRARRPRAARRRCRSARTSRGPSDGGGARGRRLRLRDAGRGAHRRRHRLDARRGARAGRRRGDVLAPLSRGQRASARGHADLPLARVSSTGPMPILAEPLRIANGYAMPSVRPGAGLAWNHDAVERYRIR